MINGFENMEYLVPALILLSGSAIILLIRLVFMNRPTYKYRYVYKKSIMKMNNDGDDPCKCDKEFFPLGNYLENVQNFVIKDETL